MGLVGTSVFLGLVSLGRLLEPLLLGADEAEAEVRRANPVVD